MKKEVNPVLIAVVLVVFVLIMGGVFYMKSQPEGGARPANAASQIRTVGGEPIPLGPVGAPPAGIAPTGGPPAAKKSSQGAQ